MTSFAAAIDADGDGRDDLTLQSTGVTTPGSGLAPETVVHQIPVPDGCQSIVWVCEGSQANASLFVSSLTYYTIYELDPATGAVLNSFPSASSSGSHGLAWDGRYLIQNGYNTYMADFTDKGTGTVAYSQPSSGGYGLTWGKTDTPHADQWLWAADHWVYSMFQDDYYTGANVFSFVCAGTNTIGAAWDGMCIWDSNWSDSTLHRYDAATGALLNTIGAPYSNPRDICWDGHYLWTIHWENSTAYQIDLYGAEGLYPITAALNPRYIKGQRGSVIRFEVTLLNHTASTQTTQAWLVGQQQQSTNEITLAGPVNLTLAAGQMLTVNRSMMIPNAAPLGIWDLYLRVGQYPTATHQDGIVVEVVP